MRIVIDVLFAHITCPSHVSTISFVWQYMISLEGNLTYLLSEIKLDHVASTWEVLSAFRCPRSGVPLTPRHVIRGLVG